MAHFVELQVVRTTIDHVGPSWNREERIDRTVTQKREFSAKTKAAAISKAMRWARGGWDMDRDFSRIEKSYPTDTHTVITLHESDAP